VRSLSGRSTEANLSTADLDRHINEYYQNTLVVEVPGIKQQQAWVEITTSSGVDSYLLQEDWNLVLGPVTIDGTPAEIVTQDAEYFYDRWPQDVDTPTGQPTEVLLIGSDLVLRPSPDAAYTVKYRTVSFPLTPLVAEGDKPMNCLYGRLIAFGTAIDLLLEKGQFDTAQALSSVYDTLLTMAKRPQILELMHQTPVPCW